jgi:cysteine-rich repeat protein
LSRLSRQVALGATAALCAIAATVVSAPPVAAQSSRAERCQSRLAAASRQYFNQVLGARQTCVRRQFSDRIPPAVDCTAVEDIGDPTTADRIEKAEIRLATRVFLACTGVDLEAMGFPGRLCPEPPDEAEFTEFELLTCVQEVNDEVIAELLEMETPQFDTQFIPPGDLKCFNAISQRGRRMTKRELTSRHECMVGEIRGPLPPDPSVDCRAQIPPYGLGTGDSATDGSIIAAYTSLLSTIPGACALSNVGKIYADGDCPDTTEGKFTLFDLQMCIFNSHRVADAPLMEVAYPSQPRCGNGVLETGEDCDDGNTNDADNCRNDCTVASCGDGAPCNVSSCTSGPGGGPEQCDDGNTVDTDACRNTCAVATCGDGATCSVSGCTSGPGSGPEQCDNGTALNGPTQPCLANCSSAACGDGLVCSALSCQSGPDNGPEACDDAGESAECNTDCSPAFCGDGKVNGSANEECDDGFTGNSNTTPDACRTNCRNPRCGDNVVDTGEQCDPPNGTTCDASCQRLACGNGELDEGEDCDDGNTVDTDACRNGCIDARCGDSVICSGTGCSTGPAGAAEQCDNGANNGANRACRANCSVAACGDGEICSQPGCTTGPTGATEQCDNGSANSDTTPNACRTDCATADCGDGVTDSGEQCDNGANNGSNRPCLGTCTNAVCGDSQVCNTTGCTSGPGGAPEFCDTGTASTGCDGDCSAVACGDGTLNTAANEECDDGAANSDTTPDACRTDCLNASCGDGVIDTGERCDEGADNGGESGCSTECECEAGSTAEGCMVTQCPASGRLVLYAGTTGIICDGNEDCPVGSCDLDLGRCVTATDLDTGWTGLAFDSDINDQVVTFGRLSCPGPYEPGTDEPCGQCEITGLDPAAGNCRCNHDNQAVCENSFELDPAACSVGVSCTEDLDCRVCSQTTSTSCAIDEDCPSGELCLNGLRLPTCVNNQCVGTCNCYFGPPLPLSSKGTPACVLNRFAQDVSGTANVDRGAGEVTANLRSVVFLGESITVPCPYCVGDTTPRDGVREGVCVLGENSGDACDVDAVNTTFPSPSGEGHSLDCFPASGKNVSGTGLRIGLRQTTGSQQVTSGVTCGFPPFAAQLCPCGICQLDRSVPCSSNADCQSQSLGNCTSQALGKPQKNACSDGQCGDTGNGLDGECVNGPTNVYCDGVARANGEPMVTCISNADCDSTDCGGGVGPGLCGTCTIERIQACFLPTILVSGQPNPEAPIGAALFCIPPTANDGINQAAGLPGPGRVVNQAQSTLFCASDPGVQYVPGVGGCPE